MNTIVNTVSVYSYHVVLETILFYFFKIYLFLTEGWLIYSILLLSVKHQHESAIGAHRPSSSCNSLSSPSPLHLSKLFELPDTYSKFLLAIYFAHDNVSFCVSLYIHLTLSSPPPMSLNLCSLIHQYHRSRFHIYMCQYMIFIFLFLTYFILYNMV